MLILSRNNRVMCDSLSHSLFVVAEIRSTHSDTSLVNEMPNQECSLCTGHALATKKERNCGWLKSVWCDIISIFITQAIVWYFWPNSNDQPATVLSISHWCDTLQFWRFKIGLRVCNFLSEEESQKIRTAGLTHIQKENFLRCFLQ